MKPAGPAILRLLGLLLLLAALVAVSISLGSAPIPLRGAALSMLGQPLADPVWEGILWQIRLPRCVAGSLAGACLALSGLLMQTLFRNPLADPYSLGISSGASLGAALAILAGSLSASGLAGGSAAWVAAGGFWSSLGVAGAAMAGAGTVMALVLAVSRRVADNTTLLILGILFGQVAGALVSVLQSLSAAEEVRALAFWSFGSFSGVSWEQMPALAAASLLGLAAAAASAKPLNTMLLGDDYARSLGVNMRAVRACLLAGASVLAGTVTAFCGPIAFLGLTVPHLGRGIFRTSDHRILVPAAALLGACLALAADIVAAWPGSDRALPLNAVLALLGAPVAIRILLKQRHPGAGA